MTRVDPAVPRSTPRVVNLPNALTVLRLAVVPVLAVVLLQDGGRDVEGRWWAAILFVAAILTDWSDGMIARRTGTVTEFGKLADPIADKALTGMALIGLSILELLPWWVTAVILVRELAVTLLRVWVLRHGVIPASRGGKLKTVAQSIAIPAYLLPLSGVLATTRWWLMAVAVVLTVGTGIDYFYRALTQRRTDGPSGDAVAGKGTDPTPRPDTTAA